MFVSRFGSDSSWLRIGATSVPFESVRIMGVPWTVYVVVALAAGSIIALVYRCVQRALEKPAVGPDPPVTAIAAIPLVHPGRSITDGGIYYAGYAGFERCHAKTSPPPYDVPSSPDTIPNPDSFLTPAVVVGPPSSYYY